MGPLFITDLLQKGRPLLIRMIVGSVPLVQLSCVEDISSAVYLCDSGGHYSDGTTDVTRTLHFGQPTAEQIDAFTRVLMGHIEIDMFQLPVTNLGCNGYRLDALARMYLWENGLDYRHGDYEHVTLDALWLISLFRNRSRSRQLSQCS